MTPFLGFVPDLDPMTPGVILDASQIIPTQKGMQACPTLVTAGPSALAAACRGAALLRNLSGVNRLIAGTAAHLYDANSTAWTQMSSSTAGYSLGSDDRWSFTQFGNSAIAATITTKIERSTSATFSAITSAPKAQIVEAVKGFVMALHTDETTYGNSPDRWWCSAFLDETDWTPAVATQATTGRLVEGGGPITAGKKLGDDIIVYKRRAMFVGRYAGPPVVWDFQQVTGEIGCTGQDAVVNIGSVHVFAAEDNIYAFDGVRPTPIADGKVREWYTSNLSATYNYRTRLAWDKRRNLVWVFFCSTASSGTPDKGLVFHTLTNRWGVVDKNVEAVVNFVSASITYDGGGAAITTYDTAPAAAYDSPMWIPSAESAAVFDSDHVLKSFSGTPGASWFVTGDVGDEDGYSLCVGLKVRFLTNPSSATATGYCRDELGRAVTACSSAMRDDGAFDLRQSARFHRFKVDMMGDSEFVAHRPLLRPAGRR